MRIGQIFSLFWTAILCSGCSVGMALSGQEEKDTSVFYNGAERSFVHAKVGLPDSAVQDKDGNWIDTYLIVKGNEPSAGRAIGHGALDVLTLGLWEVFGTPIEAAAGSEEQSRFVIYYDATQKIQKVDRIFVESQPVDEDANLRQAPTYPLEQAK